MNKYEYWNFIKLLRFKIFQILVLAFLTPVLQAAAPIEITFAVPDAGRISLGVFDRNGKLVRILHRLAAEEDFRVGLNGYITQWDGLDDAGRRLPSGPYEIKGYLLNNISVTGENFHFNDWVVDEESPVIRKILDFHLLENGDVLLLASTAGGQMLARYSPEHGFLWHREIGGLFTWGGSGFGTPTALFALNKLGSLGSFLAANSRLAIIFHAGSCAAFSLKTGALLFSRQVRSDIIPNAVTADEGNVLVASGTELIAIPLLRWESETISNLPSAFTAMDANATQLIGASQDGVWIRKKNDPFEKVSLPLEIVSLSLGLENTFWFVGSEADSGNRVTGQASFSGDTLRLLKRESDRLPQSISASRTSDCFALLESRSGFQRLLGIKYGLMENGLTGWTIEWERSIEDCARFGFAEGRIVADAGNTPQKKELKFRLKKNPLTGYQEILALRAVADKGGVHLVAAGGLPIVDVSSRGDVNRIAIQRGKLPDSIQILQGNGFFVEEFLVQGLKNILPLDAGKVDLE